MTFWDRLREIFRNTPKVWMSKEWIGEWARKS